MKHWVLRVFVQGQDRYVGEDEHWDDFKDVDERARDIVNEGGPVYMGDVKGEPMYEYFPLEKINSVQVFMEECDDRHELDRNPEKHGEAW